ncbi:NitT/TauT family transport system substrate-binding protein [Pseudochelatococcus lubricantis]|uniref:NitT/TauT family transport system substrate-binding protein n=1 Tax=Pseudochelatococcus lubricantis TaxID=1538102 RepID=A0ABX0V3G1_9HYPH|nr:ABC transporter substrate-binding protein [Pseudochelatococcus lubricantis]NIJ59756.1 NitT/TauT family transport system substrate-binding protein [Pseudochelatococcus lubricantis]
MVDRRSFIAGLAFASLAARARAAEPLVLWGPPAAPSIVLAQAVASGALKEVAPDVTFKVWKTPDEMRAGISAGTFRAVVVPTYVASNLYNRGLGVRLLNVLTDGLLFVVAPSGTVKDIAGLRGRKVAVPFRNDMPDFIFRRMLASAGLAASDIDVDYSGTPAEAVQLLLTGRADAAFLTEPLASAAILRAATAGRTLERAIDAQEVWRKITGRQAIPQAGLAITDKLAADIGGGGIAALQTALEGALGSVLKDPATAAAVAAPALELPAPVIERAIPFSSLVVRRASAARADLAALFDALAEADPRIIGGKQPDDGFFAL